MILNAWVKPCLEIALLSFFCAFMKPPMGALHADRGARKRRASHVAAETASMSLETEGCDLAKVWRTYAHGVASWRPGTRTRSLVNRHAFAVVPNPDALYDLACATDKAFLQLHAFMPCDNIIVVVLTASTGSILDQAYKTQDHFIFRTPLPLPHALAGPAGLPDPAL